MRNVKIKTDFVTNSSSTTYLVCIPDNFLIRREDIQTDMTRDWLDDHDLCMPVDKLLKEFNAILGTLRDRGWIHEEMDHIDGAQVVYVMTDMFRTHDFIINSWESGSSNGQVMCLTNDEITKITKIKASDILNNIEVKDENQIGLHHK